MFRHDALENIVGLLMRPTSSAASSKDNWLAGLAKQRSAALSIP